MLNEIPNPESNPTSNLPLHTAITLFPHLKPPEVGDQNERYAQLHYCQLVQAGNLTPKDKSSTLTVIDLKEIGDVNFGEMDAGLFRLLIEKIIKKGFRIIDLDVTTSIIERSKSVFSLEERLIIAQEFYYNLKPECMFGDMMDNMSHDQIFSEDFLSDEELNSVDEDGNKTNSL